MDARWKGSNLTTRLLAVALMLTAWSAVARPAWKQWVTRDFGIDGKQVDALWSEVARIEREANERDFRSYGQ